MSVRSIVAIALLCHAVIASAVINGVPITLGGNLTILACHDVKITRYKSANLSTMTCQASDPTFALNFPNCWATLTPLPSGGYALTCG